MKPASGALPPGHTAQILAFPARDRAVAKTGREQRFAALEAAARGLAAVAPTSGWYHEDAIAEDRDSRH